MVEPALDIAAQIAVGDDPDQPPVVVGHPDHAEPLGGHLDDRIVHRGVGADQRHRVAAVHQPR